MGVGAEEEFDPAVVAGVDGAGLWVSSGVMGDGIGKAVSLPKTNLANAFRGL
jgi:hypothetical protein